jgi:hypothetical protein
MLLATLAAFLAGALNSVAGGGSFLTVPTLIFGGIDPVVANATSTVALWPGSLAAAVGYRRELASTRRVLESFAWVSALGGGAGAVLLVVTPSSLFERLLPWLLLTATLVFTAGPWLVKRLPSRDADDRVTPGALAVQLAIALYGGYFGGGIGFLMLAGFAVLGLGDIHVMNALKVVLGALINGVAVVTFALAGIVSWSAAGLMVIGAVAGGYLGAALVRRLPPAKVRWFVVALGWGMTAVFFARG